MGKTITSIIRLKGKRHHKNIPELADDILKECDLNNIIKTSKGTILTKDVIINIIRGVLSNIKKGKGCWDKWSFRVGKDYIKLYDETSFDSKDLNVLESSLYKDNPEIRVLVNPRIDDVDMDEHFMSFDTLSEAKKFVDENKSALDIFVFIDKLKIPLNYKCAC